METIYKLERGKVEEALSDARKMAALAPNNNELAGLLADLALIAGAPDAENLNLDFFHGSDEMTD